MSQCTAERKDGTPCDGNAVRGDFCFPHAHLGLTGKAKQEYFKERREDIVRRYKDKAGGDLAREYDVHIIRIHQILKEHRKKTKDSKKPPTYTIKLGKVELEHLLGCVDRECPLTKRRTDRLRRALDSAEQAEVASYRIHTDDMSLILDMQSFVQHMSLQRAVDGDHLLSDKLSTLARNLFRMYTAKKK